MQFFLDAEAEQSVMRGGSVPLKTSKITKKIVIFFNCHNMTV